MIINFKIVIAFKIITSLCRGYTYTDSSLNQLNSKSAAGYFAGDTNASLYAPSHSASSTDAELLSIDAAPDR